MLTKCRDFGIRPYISWDSQNKIDYFEWHTIRREICRNLSGVIWYGLKDGILHSYVN